MCRSRTLCCLLCLLFCCFLPVAAMADDGPEEPEVTTVEFLRELGLNPDDGEAVDAFLNWLYPLAPGSEGDMALILSGSVYSGMDSEKVYFLWHSLHTEYEVSVAANVPAGTSVGYLGLDQANGRIFVASRLPNNAFDQVPYTNYLDLGQYMSSQGYLTTADLDFTTLENLASQSNDKLGHLLTEAQNIYTALYGNIDGSIYSFLRRMDYNVLNLYNELHEMNSFSRSWAYDGKANGLAAVSGSGDAWTLPQVIDTNFKDLDSLLLKNFRSSFSMEYLLNWSFGDILCAGSGFSDLLAGIGQTLFFSSVDSSGDMLFADGTVDMGDPYEPLVQVVRHGFLGLNTNMETALVGGHGGSAGFEKVTFDEKLNKKTETVTYTNLLTALTGIGSSLQNPLSQLQAVLAGDGELELRRNTQENVDAVTDNFTGDGAGAVSGGDMSNASGLTSGIGNSFSGNPVSADNAFQAVSDSGNYNFFSQETANALDSVSFPAAAALADGDDDSWLDGYVQDENGFYTVGDQTGWSIFDYLRKEDE